MNLLKYFTHQYRLLIYASLALFFALLTTNLIQDFTLQNITQLFIMNIVLAYIMRTNSDIYHYKQNRRARKKQFISRNGLIILLVILSVVYLSLNILFYKHLGVFSVLLLGIIYVWELFPFGKIIFLPLTNMFYLYFYNDMGAFRHPETWFCLVILLLASIGVYYYKWGKK